jgi:hypothetical protein
MLIRKSSSIAEDFYLLTFGGSSFYLMVLSDGRRLLFDCGLSVHVDALSERLASLQLPQASELPELLFLTGSQIERIGGLHRFHESEILCSEKLCHYLQVTENRSELLEKDVMLSRLFKHRSSNNSGSVISELKTNSKVKSASEPSLKLHPIPDRQDLDLDGKNSLRLYSQSSSFGQSDTPGFGEVTAVYLPHVSAIILSCPFGAYSPESFSVPLTARQRENLAPLIKELLTLDFSLLCMPFEGVLQGELGRNYLESLLKNGEALHNEAKLAIESGVTSEEVRDSLQDIFQVVRAPDPLLKRHISFLESEFMIEVGIPATS